MVGIVRAAFNSVWPLFPLGQAVNKDGAQAIGDVIDSQLINIANTVSLNKIYTSSWAELATVSGSLAKQGAEVPDSDVGTHTDPVVGNAVSNAGSYQWSVSPAGWKRIGGTGLSAKVDKSQTIAGSGLAQVTGSLGGAPAIAVPAASASTTILGTATDQAVTPFGDKAALDARVPMRRLRTSNRIPFMIDASGNVPVWLENGLLSFFGLSASAQAVVLSLISGLVEKSPRLRATSLIPIVRDQSGNVGLWLENGLIGAKGISNGLLASVVASVSALFPPLTSVPAYNRPLIATDGRSLTQYRAKRAALMSAGTGIVRLGVAGDSWVERTLISKALSDMFTAAYGKSGEGWLNLNGSLLNGVMTKSGWTLYDADTALVAPTYGCGPDGLGLYATGTTATLGLTGLTTTELKIFYRDTTGTFRYRVDGGSWTSVTGGGTNNIASVTISGLSNAVHTFDIDTTGNTGTVAINGLYATRSGVAGVEYNKMGNGGATGQSITFAAPFVADFASVLSLDALIIILGTNDFNLSKGAASYIAGQTAYINAWKAVNPNLGIALVMPAQCSPTGAVSFPESDYRTALLNFAQTNGYEYYSAFDEFGSYASENALGQFIDNLHLSTAGSWRLAKGLFSRIFGV